MKRIIIIILGVFYSLLLSAQINTDRVILIGRNALYFEDYILSIQYFNQAIKSKPYLAEPYYYRAVAKYLLDDSRGAEEDCSLAIDRNPFMTMAYQLRGDTRMQQDNFEGATADFKKALEVYPNDKFLLINLGAIGLHNKDYAKSEEIVNDLISKHPRYTEAYLIQGAMYQEKGDTIKALESYNHALTLDKYHPQTYARRGILYYQSKEYDKAMDDINEAIHLEPNQIGNYINRGLIKYSQNDLRGAMADYDKVMDLDNYNVIARFNRGLLRSKVGDFNRAVEDFDVVLQSEPANFIALINRGLTKNNIGDYRGALKDIDTVLEQYPEFYQGFYTRAEIKRKQNDLKGAQADQEYARREEKRIREEYTKGAMKDSVEMKTREKSDKSIDKFNLLVVADRVDEEKNKYQNKYRGRIQNRQVKLDPEPRFVVSYYERDSEVRSTVNFNQEINNINKAAVLPRTLRITNSVIALNELQIKEHFRSIDDLSEKLGKDERNALLFFARGLEYMLVQDFVSSIQDFEKAIEIDPSFGLAYFNLAIVYTKQVSLKEDRAVEFDRVMGNNNDNVLSKEKEKEALATGAVQPIKVLEYDKIHRNYNKVIELDPGFVYAYYNRGELDYYNNDYRSAVLNYNEAIRRNPEFAEAYYNRGLSRFHLKDEKRALEDMRKAGELGILEAYSIIKRITE